MNLRVKSLSQTFKSKMSHLRVAILWTLWKAPGLTTQSYRIMASHGSSLQVWLGPLKIRVLAGTQERKPQSKGVPDPGRKLICTWTRRDC